MVRLRATAALALLLVAGACHGAKRAPATYPVLVRAFDDLGQPLASVALSIGGVELGMTDAGGQRRLNIPGEEGQRVEVAASCPAGYTGPDSAPAVVLKGTGTAPEQAETIGAQVICESKDHVALIAVRTGQAGLPILLRGEPVAQTGSTGTAHVQVREPAGHAFQLTLDTEGHPELRPESPTRTFVVAQQDEFAVWDQPFELGKRGAGARKHGKSKSGATFGAGRPKHTRERQR